MLLPTALSAALLAPAPIRPPAVPLIVCDPYFSIWSCADQLNTDWPRHWTGAVNALQMMLRVDGTTWRLMGAAPPTSAPARQLSCEVRPTTTRYRFAAGPVEVALSFRTPALPGDLEQLSRPVGYVTCDLRSTDGGRHVVQLYFDHSGELVVNEPAQPVVWSRPQLPGLTVTRMGSAAQPVLGRKGDNLRIDWGYLYVATADPAQVAVVGHEAARGGFVTAGKLPSEDDPRQPRPANDDWPVAATVFDCGEVGEAAVRRSLVLAYDDLYSIEYLGQRLAPYWRRHGWGAAELLRAAVADQAAVAQRCEALDAQLLSDLEAAGGPRYASLCALAFRQCLGGHKLAADSTGRPLWFSKENFSNGCIATVDVSYPSAPFMLLFNPALLRAMLDPVLDYAASARWKFPFAPHDLGTYPLANGQVYGGGETGEENQMPVEECGNLLILVAALAQAEGHAEYARAHWRVLTTWAEYLKEFGFDPGKQLCTDDFAGHLAHNANLSVKAQVALAGYARLCELLGQTAAASEYRKLAEEGVAKWEAAARDGEHYRLAFDQPGTWSQKYNLVWDKLLDLKLFPPAVAAREVAFYLTQQNRYGLPLDNRSGFTKADWIIWSATLAERPEDWHALVDPVFAFANESPSRVPLTDWYWTADARQRGFQARTVVGGLFIKLLADEAVWRRWRTARESP
ncbi:MAG: DUF4965 domain-containing protein [Fimbriimonadaceae bacterium]|nr:DUF4965 domain-containing protein [Fimbriimonadaceae bacterium]